MPKKIDTKSPNQTYKKVALSFIFLTFFLLLIVVYFSIGEAQVTINPRSEIATIDFNVWIGERAPGDKSADFLSGQLIDAAVTKEKEYQPKEFVERLAKATGAVIISNEQTKDQTLVATTRLLTADNLLFRLKKTVAVPAGGEITAEVEADFLGETGNIGPAQFTVPGLWPGVREKVKVASLTSMTGGVVKAGQLKQSDLDAAREDLISELQKETFASLVEKRSISDVGNLEKEVSEVKFSAAAGQEVSGFKVSAKLHAWGLVFNKESLLNLAKEKLKDQRAQGGWRLVDYDLSSFAYQLAAWSQDKTAAQFKVQLAAKAAYDKEQIFVDKNSLKSLSAVAAKALLEKRPEIGQAEIELWPFWVSKIPKNVKKIKVE